MKKTIVLGIMALVVVSVLVVSAAKPIKEDFCDINPEHKRCVEIQENPEIPPPAYPMPPEGPNCSNGIDDDEDGLIDYPDDPGCFSELDWDEWNEEE